MVTDTYSSFIVGLIPVLAGKLELSIFMVSILTATNFITNNLTQPLFGYLSDRYGLRYFLLAGPVLASVFLSLIGIAPSYYVILIFLFLGNLGVAAIHPPSAAIASYFGGRRKGLSNSIVSFGGSIGYASGSLFIILIVKKLGLNFTPVAMIPALIIFPLLLKFSRSISRFNKNENRVSFLKRFKMLRKARILLLGMIMFSAFSRDVLIYSLLTFMPLYLTSQGVKLLNFGVITTVFILVGGIGGLFAGFYSDRIKKELQ
ncbi:MAG: MFS transporter [Actinobacteria bacterium]|nr:MFS transporter [Actinomycetota bacterium]